MSERAPAVLVHGDPETDAVWDPLLAELGSDDVVRLSPPGFGAPIPPGFGATVGEYRDWLVGRLEDFDGPVDLGRPRLGRRARRDRGDGPSGPAAQPSDRRDRPFRSRLRLARPGPDVADPGRGGKPRHDVRDAWRDLCWPPKPVRRILPHPL